MGTGTGAVSARGPGGILGDDATQLRRCLGQSPHLYTMFLPPGKLPTAPIGERSSLYVAPSQQGRV